MRLILKNKFHDACLEDDLEKVRQIIQDPLYDPFFFNYINDGNDYMTTVIHEILKYVKPNSFEIIKLIINDKNYPKSLINLEPNFIINGVSIFTSALVGCRLNNEKSKILKEIYKNPKFDQNLLNQDNVFHSSSFIHACSTNDLEIIKLFLNYDKFNVDLINKKNLVGQTPIHMVCRYPKKINIEIIKLFLNNKHFDFDQIYIDFRGSSPIKSACYSLNTNFLIELIKIKVVKIPEDLDYSQVNIKLKKFINIYKKNPYKYHYKLKFNNHKIIYNHLHLLKFNILKLLN